MTVNLSVRRDRVRQLRNAPPKVIPYDAWCDGLFCFRGEGRQRRAKQYELGVACRDGT